MSVLWVGYFLISWYKWDILHIFYTIYKYYHLFNGLNIFFPVNISLWVTYLFTICRVTSFFHDINISIACNFIVFGIFTFPPWIHYFSKCPSIIIFRIFTFPSWRYFFNIWKTFFSNKWTFLLLFPLSVLCTGIFYL